MSDSWIEALPVDAQPIGNVASAETHSRLSRDNPFAVAGNSEEIVLAIPAESARPRVWTVYTLVVLTLVTSLIVSTITMFVALRIHNGPLTPSQVSNMGTKLHKFLETRAGFLVSRFSTKRNRTRKRSH